MMNILTYRNNWENDEYYVDGKRISNLKSVKINEKEYTVAREKVSKSYNDMGHNYTSTSWHYFVAEEVFGTMIVFDLNKVVGKVEVTAVEFVE